MNSTLLDRVHGCRQGKGWGIVFFPAVVFLVFPSSPPGVHVLYTFYMKNELGTRDIRMYGDRVVRAEKFPLLLNRYRVFRGAERDRLAVVGFYPPPPFPPRVAIRPTDVQNASADGELKGARKRTR